MSSPNAACGPASQAGDCRKPHPDRSGPVARLQSKSLEAPDEVRPTPFGRVDIYNLDDVVIGRMVFEPGWHWLEHVQPIAGTRLCQYHHVGICIQGRQRIRMEDGSTLEIGAGTVFDIPPGHDGWVASDEPFIAYDVAGVRSFARVDESAQRVLGAILFTDIVDSTSIAESIGETRWREQVGAHNERIQFELDRFRGRLVKTTGDGVLAMFDSSDRAIRAAAAICQAAREMGLPIRAGVHSGEVELVAGDVRGLAVHVAARVMAAAGPSQVWISATTHELVAGSGLVFVDAGIHELKGVTGARQLYRLSEAPAPAAEPTAPA
jgi:class 3 adenylate cyclase